MPKDLGHIHLITPRHRKTVWIPVTLGVLVLAIGLLGAIWYMG
jgi:hypothetical protein